MYKLFWTRLAGHHLIAMIKQLLFYIFTIIFEKDVFEMAMAYAILIINGRKEYKNVPARLKEQVAEILRDLDCEYLIEE
jgi:hypothetical protein